MKKRRLFSFLLLLVLLAGMFSVPAFADGEEADDTGPFEVHAKAAILLDMNTDRIIYEKNLDERVYPASLTKIMTCLVALDDCSRQCTWVLRPDSLFAFWRCSRP